VRRDQEFRFPHELAEEARRKMQTGAAHSRPLGSNQEVRKHYDAVAIKSRKFRLKNMEEKLSSSIIRRAADVAGYREGDPSRRVNPSTDYTD
jgi:hypothetical protein